MTKGLDTSPKLLQAVPISTGAALRCNEAIKKEEKIQMYIGILKKIPGPYFLRAFSAAIFN